MSDRRQDPRFKDRAFIDSEPATKAHIALVAKNMEILGTDLAIRSIEHDLSKLGHNEKPYFDHNIPIHTLTFQGPGYKAELIFLRPALEHHYANNRHHPEHHKDGINGMTLVDMIEMFCDWCASTERHGNTGDIGRSLRFWVKQRNLSPQLAQIMLNTAKAYRMGMNHEHATLEDPEG